MVSAESGLEFFLSFRISCLTRDRIAWSLLTNTVLINGFMDAGSSSQKYGGYGTANVTAKNTTKQLKLQFDSLEDAISWCQNNSYEYRVDDQTFKKIKPKNYASNFASNRKTSWTH